MREAGELSLALQKEQYAGPAGASDDVADRARGTIYQIEIDRVKYALACYLRLRLRKLERHGRFIGNTPELHGRLSPAELGYLQRYQQLADSALQSLFLGRLPEHLRGLSEPDMRDEPDLDQYVFALLKDKATVEDSGERLELALGDLVVIKYSTVRDLVLQYRATLI